MVGWTPCQGQNALQHSNLQDKIQYEKDWVLATNCAHDEEVMKTFVWKQVSVLTNVHKVGERML